MKTRAERKAQREADQVEVDKQFAADRARQRREVTAMRRERAGRRAVLAATTVMYGFTRYEIAAGGHAEIAGINQHGILSHGQQGTLVLIIRCR